MPKTTVLRSSNDPALLDEVVDVLARGALVILPTETVYGLAARGDDPQALERLRQLKGRGEAPFARLVADLAAVERSGVVFPEAARRLAVRYWPGPLTLVLDAPDGTTLGFRVPGHEFTRQVVARAGFPVVATSANLSGQPDTLQFGPALEAVGSGVELAVDGGPTALGAASTVVRVSPSRGLEVLREGFLDRETVARTALRTVVFVCTGNTCRSPMAAALFRRLLARETGAAPDRLEAAGWRVESAGVAAGRGQPASAHAVTAMRARGLDISGHRSQPIGEELLERADLVVALSSGHLHALQEGHPRQRGKLVLLDPRGVPDPIGGDLDVYEETARHIEGCLEALYEARFRRAAPPPLTPPRQRPCPPREAFFPAADTIPSALDLRHYPDGDLWLVGGEVRRWAGPTAPVHSVFCEPGPDGQLVRREIGRTALLDSGAALEALNAARQAWDLGRGEWPRMSVHERMERLQDFAEGLSQQRELIARLLMWEVGKTWADALSEVDRTVEYVDATLHALAELRRMGRSLQAAGGVLGLVQRAPLGVCLCMGPFNYPLNETYTTVIPALAMGNTMVIKLPKLGMLCNLPLLPVLARAFPPGVVNVIQGDGATLIGPIMESGGVDVLAFIGSSRVAGIVEKQHPAPFRLTTVLGMDAKNPAIVLPDADLDLAVSQVTKGALSYNGQRCTALKLIFVHRSLADRFVERLAAAVDALPAGLMWEEGVALTPLPEDGKPAALHALLDDAVAKGARVVNRGGWSSGTWFAPAVLYPVSAAARLFHEEQFGPLVPVVPFDDLDEVYRAIAASPYGQQVSVFGQDAAVLGPLVDVLANQVCRINLNRQCQRGPDVFPFTGRKHSAEGVLSVGDALETFSIPSMVATGDDQAARGLWERLLDEGGSRFIGE